MQTTSKWENGNFLPLYHGNMSQVEVGILKTELSLISLQADVFYVAGMTYSSRALTLYYDAKFYESEGLFLGSIHSIKNQN